MPQRELDKLFINLSASQTRKRLKGHGFGVKRVESAGRHQAIVYHTATGQHLRELQLLFADVQCSTAAEQLEPPLETMRNLGATSAHWLEEAGIQTQAELRGMGPVLAYRLVKRCTPQVTLNLLWSLAGRMPARTIILM